MYLYNHSHIVLMYFGLRVNACFPLSDPVQQAISWSEENIQAQLPLGPGYQLCFSLLVTGNSDFLMPAPDTPARKYELVLGRYRYQVCLGIGIESIYLVKDRYLDRVGKEGEKGKIQVCKGIAPFFILIFEILLL